MLNLDSRARLNFSDMFGWKENILYKEHIVQYIVALSLAVLLELLAIPVTGVSMTGR